MLTTNDFNFKPYFYRSQAYCLYFSGLELLMAHRTFLLSVSKGSMNIIYLCFKLHDYITREKE